MRPPGEQYFEALTSLRGIAAVVVVGCHLAGAAPDPGLFDAFQYPGISAVILFFTVSGFVLQVQAERRPSYLAFLTKRVARIYGPYLAALLVAYGAYRSFPGSETIRWSAPLASYFWPHPFPQDALVGHFVLLLPFVCDQLNPVLWSLVYEMRISIVFPFISALTERFADAILLGSGLALSIAVSLFLTHRHIGKFTADHHGLWLPTVNYIWSFLCGALLARRRVRIVSGLTRYSHASAPICVGSAAALWFAYYLQIPLLPYVGFYGLHWIATVASCGLIAGALVPHGRLSHVLGARPLIFLGEISYGMYLYHGILILALVHMLPHAESYGLVEAATVALIVPVGWLSLAAIESPCTRAGRYLASAIERRAGVSSSAPRLR